MGLNIGQVDPQTIQKLLFGGPQSMFSPQSESSPTPQADPPAPQRGSVSQAMQSAPPAEPTAPAPPTQTAPASTQPPSPSMPTPVSPDSIKNPYQVPKHGTLAKIMLGVGEALGNPLATRIGERDRSLSEKSNEFEATGRTETAAKLNREAMQTAEAGSNIQRTQYDIGKEQQTAKANAISQIMGEVESGKYGAGDSLLSRWRRIAQANPHIGLTDEDIQGAISGTHPLGSKYTLTRDAATEAPVELVDREGKHYSKSNLPDDPEAQQMWSDAETAASGKFQNEQTIANNAAERQGAAQSRGFEHAAAQQQRTQDFATQQKGREAMMSALSDIRTAQNNQQLIEKLGASGDHASRSAIADQLAQALAPPGSRRLSPIAIDQIMESGSLSQKGATKLKNWLTGSGPIPEESIPEWINAAKALNANKMKTANDALEDIHSTYGVKHPKAADNGRLDQQNQQGTQPKGATHTGIGDQDKKKHWLDAQGNDLGLAE